MVLIRGVGLWLHSFLTTALEWSECSEEQWFIYFESLLPVL